MLERDALTRREAKRPIRMKKKSTEDTTKTNPTRRVRKHRSLMADAHDRMK